MIQAHAAIGAKPGGGPGQRPGQKTSRDEHIAPDKTGAFGFTQHLQPDVFIIVPQRQHLGLAVLGQRPPFVDQHRHGFATATHDRLQLATDQRQYALAHTAGLGNGRTHQRGVIANGLLHHRAQDFILAFEVMKNAARLNAHGTGQVAYGGALVAFIAKQVSCHLQQLATGTVRIGQLATVDQFAHDPQRFLLIHPISPTVVITAKTAGLRGQFKLMARTKQALGQKIFSPFTNQALAW